MKINAVFVSREPNRAGVLMEAISRGGFSVTVTQQGKEALGLMAQRGCDLFLVGAMAADGEGVQLVRTLRGRGATRQMPIVALVDPSEANANGGNSAAPSVPSGGFGSAAGSVRTRGAIGSPGPGPQTGGKVPLRLAFFQAGADECLTLNQDVAECLARIKAVLRRTMAHPMEEVVRMGIVDLNLTSYTLRVGGKEVPLTSKEIDLLYVFLSSPNRVLSRPYLIERVWGYNYFGSPRTVDVHVRRLREKLGKAADFIQTIPCVGYKLVPPGGELRR